MFLGAAFDDVLAAAVLAGLGVVEGGVEGGVGVEGEDQGGEVRKGGLVGERWGVLALV